MPSPKELAKALAYRGEIRNTPQNSFLGGVANFLAPVSEFADQYKISDRIPFLGGMSAADLTGLKGAQSLVNDMSYGTPPIRGASLQTAKVDPRVLDLAGVSGAMMPVGKALGKAALREGARQIETGTGIGRAVVDPRSPITTWHGSPHTFPPTANNPLGEFSNENIGSGLGGQGYGRGHYVAEAPTVGEGYRNAGANSPEITYMGETYKASSPQGDLLREVHQMGKMNAIRKYPDQTDFIRGVKVNDIKFTGGNLYKVDLPDEHVAKMLEWDKPINEQSPYVLEALNKAGINTESSSIAGPMAIGQESHLAKHGITGIRYPDNPSIGTKEGTSNFVVFDPKHMNILERNGVGGAMMQRPKTELNSLNPTGGLFVDYTPNLRATQPLGNRMTTLDKTMGGSPEDMITIYRGAPKNQKGIVAGDFVTDMPELAKSYAGEGNILKMNVRRGDVLDDITEPLGNEYIYRPKTAVKQDRK
jgi:hypothetical protein